MNAFTPRLLKSMKIPGLKNLLVSWVLGTHVAAKPRGSFRKPWALNPHKAPEPQRDSNGSKAFTEIPTKGITMGLTLGESFHFSGKPAQHYTTLTKSKEVVPS